MQRLLVASTKGGTGKTTVTALLAHGLARRGLQVGLLDLDIHSPSAAYALGLERAPTLGLDTDRGAILPVEVNGVWLVTMASHFGEGHRITWQGPEKLTLVRELLQTTIAWGTIDWLLLDSPPSQSEELLGILEDLPHLTGAVVVSQPSDFSAAAMERLIDLFLDRGVPLWGLVANMDGVECPHCGTRSYVSASRPVNMEEWCQERGIPFLLSIPQRAGSLAPFGDQLAELILNTPAVKLPSGKTLHFLMRQAAKKALGRRP